MLKRDGANPSVWQGTADPYIVKNKTGKKEFDIAIAGGGITGITTALILQEAGFSCVVLESETVCFGTTSGTTAHINTLLDVPYSTLSKNFGQENAALVRSCVAEALLFIEKNVYTYNADCGFKLQDAFLFATEETQQKELDEIMNASEKAGIELMEAESIPVPVPFLKAMRAAGQARFHPIRYVYALANAFEEAGGVIVEMARVLEVEENEKVQVRTTEGDYFCNHLIYATHTPPGINFLHTRLVPYRSYAMAVTLEDELYPDHLTYDMYDPYHYYRTQVIDGRSYLIVGGKDHKTGKEANTEACFLALEAHIRKYFPVREVMYKWSSQYYESVDGLPYIGFLPGKERTLVATGFGGNGMIYSSVAALVLRDILLGKEHAAVKLFDPSRIKPVAGFTEFVKHNTGAVKELLKKLIPVQSIDVVAEMAPGEGRLVQYEGEKLGLYKDEQGQLHAVLPSCSHMHCDVQWNGTEKSWDCPCHGARYAPNGDLLNGPSTAPLKTIRLAD